MKTATPYHITDTICYMLLVHLLEYGYQSVALYIHNIYIGILTGFAH